MKKTYSQNEFIFIVINSIFIVFFISTSILNISLSHIFALIISIILLILFYYYYSNSITLTNEELEYKMNNLVPDYNPKFIYLEPDFIILYDSFKESIPNYNPRVLSDIIKLTDKLLEISYNSSLTINEAPIAPDIYLGEINYTESNKQVKLNISILSTYKNIAEELLNKTNGLIMYNTVVTPNIEYNFIKFLKELQTLIKINYNLIVNNLTNESMSIQNIQKQDIQMHMSPYKEYNNIFQTNAYRL